MSERTVSIMGMELPVIAVLSDEYVLAEKDRCPAIVAEAVGFMSSLRFSLDDPDGVPVEIANKAIDAYVARQMEACS